MTRGASGRSYETMPCHAMQLFVLKCKCLHKIEKTWKSTEKPRSCWDTRGIPEGRCHGRKWKVAPAGITKRRYWNHHNLTEVPFSRCFPILLLAPFIEKSSPRRYHATPFDGTSKVQMLTYVFFARVCSLLLAWEIDNARAWGLWKRGRAVQQISIAIREDAG